ncbi:hypothetical protein [Neobacillus sp. D3-1R]|uniref:hypothetical protein n=1 Tax=Neobacillus sp. D3-1R TaxID=3445778 RepID=UPI003FA04748
MVTLAFVLIFTMLTSLVGMIDIFFLHKSIGEFFYSVLSLEFGTRKWWVFFGLFLGLFYSIMTDYKRFRKKKGVPEGTQNGT